MIETQLEVKVQEATDTIKLVHGTQRTIHFTLIIIAIGEVFHQNPNLLYLRACYEMCHGPSVYDS